MKITAIILAAGKSQRFGDDDKLLALFEGKPLAQWVVDALADVEIDRKIAVISNDDLLTIFDGFDLVRLDAGACNQSDSLKAGIEYAEQFDSERILILLADMPFVTKTLIQSVIEKSISGTVSACTDGIKITPPACFSNEFIPKLRNISGDKGARDILKKLDPEALVKVCSQALTDIDKQPDLQKIKSR